MKEKSDISEDEEEGKRKKEDEENEDEAEDEEVLPSSPLNYAMEMPSPEHNPYKPPVYAHELDPNFDEDFEEDEIVIVRRNRGIISCVGLSSCISSEEIMCLIEYYNLEGRWLRPRSFMRMHVFNLEGLPVPRMVLSKILVELGCGSPMHPFLHQIINIYNIPPIQLSPNSYRTIIGLYMMYRGKGYDAPSVDEVTHFLQIRRAPKDLGFFYVAFWPKY